MDELPNDLLISIASRLPVKEAGRSSVVARGWRNIWNFSRVLNFDGSEKLATINSLEFERDRFVEWVNRVVSLHCGENMDEFSVGFNLDSRHANEIDRWIEFAVRKRVQKLELNFQSRVTNGSWSNFISRNQIGVAYRFPNVIKYLNNLPFSLSLVSLYLTKVELPQEILDSFMSNCPTLEHLHLENVKGFTVFPPSFLATRLSRLALSHCNSLKRINTDPNRVSSLIHLTLGSARCITLLRHLDELSGCLSRLETLTLNMAISRVRSWTDCQSLPRLKKLVLQMEAFEEAGTVVLAALVMSVAPLLREIVLQLIPAHFVKRPRHPRYPIFSLMGRKHEHLKVLEIESGDGIAAGFEVAVYVLEHAAALDKVLIDGLAYTTAQDLHLLKEDLLRRIFIV